MDIFWDKAVKILKEKVSQQNFETWIRPIRITTMEGDQVHLRVPNRFFRDWLVENYLALIRESMKSAAGISFHVEWMIEQEIHPKSNGWRMRDDAPAAAENSTQKTFPCSSSLHPECELQL